MQEQNVMKRQILIFGPFFLLSICLQHFVIHIRNSSFVLNSVIPKTRVEHLKVKLSVKDIWVIFFFFFGIENEKKNAHMCTRRHGMGSHWIN